MYKRTNTVYPVLQQFIQKAYPVINQNLGKRYPGQSLIFQKVHPAAGRHLHIYSKSIETPQVESLFEPLCYGVGPPITLWNSCVYLYMMLYMEILVDCLSEKVIG